MAWVGKKRKAEKAAKRAKLFKPWYKPGKIAKAPEAQALWSEISKWATTPKAEGGLGWSRARWKVSRKETVLARWLQAKGITDYHRQLMFIEDALGRKGDELHKTERQRTFEDEARKREERWRLEPLPPIGHERQELSRLRAMLKRRGVTEEAEYDEAARAIKEIVETESRKATEKWKRRRLFREELHELGINPYTSKDIMGEYKAKREAIRKRAEELGLITEVPLLELKSAVEFEEKRRAKEMELFRPIGKKEEVVKWDEEVRAEDWRFKLPTPREVGTVIKDEETLRKIAEMHGIVRPGERLGKGALKERLMDAWVSEGRVAEAPAKKAMAEPQMPPEIPSVQIDHMDLNELAQAVRERRLMTSRAVDELLNEKGKVADKMRVFKGILRGYVRKVPRKDAEPVEWVR